MHKHPFWIASALLLSAVASANCSSEVNTASSSGAGQGGAGAAGGSNTTGVGGSNATGNGGDAGSGGLMDIDGGQAPDASTVDASADGVYPINDGPVCASRPPTCIPNLQSTPEELAKLAIDELFFQCCSEVGCGCTGLCQESEVFFDAGGCATQIVVQGYMKPELVDCVHKKLNEKSWLCTAGKSVVHEPFCPPC